MSEKTKQKYTLSGTPQFMPFGRALGVRPTTMYTYRELSAFCLQVSLLLKAAVPLDEGLRIMAEDGADEDEKRHSSSQTIPQNRNRRYSTQFIP